LVRHAIMHSPRATRMEYIGPAATGRARCPHLPRPTRRTMGYAHRLRARCSGCAACCRRRRWLRSGDKETQDRESLRHRRRRERLSGEISCRLSKHHLPLLCLGANLSTVDRSASAGPGPPAGCQPQSPGPQLPRTARLHPPQHTPWLPSCRPPPPPSSKDLRRCASRVQPCLLSIGGLAPLLNGSSLLLPPL
jgi:hypothetical protein